MATYSTNQFKSGLKLLLDGEPYSTVQNELVKPGTGHAFTLLRLCNSSPATSTNVTSHAA